MYLLTHSVLSFKKKSISILKCRQCIDLTDQWSCESCVEDDKALYGIWALTILVIAGPNEPLILPTIVFRFWTFIVFYAIFLLFDESHRKIHRKVGKVSKEIIPWSLDLLLQIMEYSTFRNVYQTLEPIYRFHKAPMR